jgi:hypothetical protein
MKKKSSGGKKIFGAQELGDELAQPIDRKRQ